MILRFTILVFFISIYFTSVLADEVQEQFTQDQSYKMLKSEIDLSELYNDKSWFRLLQVWHNILFLETSRIDDPEYFISKEGKHNPREELYATIHSFLEHQDSDSDNNPQCRFPARFQWINESLKLVERGLVRKAPCVRYVTWRENLSTEDIKLIFPAAYLNNPASMFGHTLFRLDSKKGRLNPLLSYAANFGAATGNDGGIAFALKGLLGGYAASFSVEPYYETVQRYGDIEHRDIWEYELKLTPDERERFLSLLWELGNTYFDYYFFDENCSFYVLALLEYTRPSLDLLSKFSFWVIPSDTLKVLYAEEDLIGEVSYRPSLATRLETSAENLLNSYSDSSLEYAMDIVDGSTELKPPSDDLEKEARILEFSFDYLEYLSSKSREVSTESRGIAKRILETRSSLPPLKSLDYAVPEFRPDETHTSGRMILSSGAREGNAFYNISLKPAYHDVLDIPAGFREGAAIDFFHLNLRHYESRGLELQSFIPVSIESYTPWGKVFRPFSWDVKGGSERELIPKSHSSNQEGSLLGFLEGSTGLTFKLFSDIMFNSLLTFRGNVAPAYANDPYAFGAGPKARIFVPLSDQLRWMLGGKLLRYEIGESHTNYTANSEFQFDITSRYLFRAGVSYEKSFGADIKEFYFGIGAYF